MIAGKKKDWKKELHTFQIHMKDGREKFLNEVAKWWECMYPQKAAFFKWALKNLRSVQNNADASYVDSKGREAYVAMRVPSELMLFIQSWIPEFGRESADTELLCRVWCDLVRCRKDNRRRTRLYVTEEFKRELSSPHAETGGPDEKEGTEEETEGTGKGGEGKAGSDPSAGESGAGCREVREHSRLGNYHCPGLRSVAS